MDTPVFFFEALTSADVLTLNEDISRHAVQVLRMKPSDRLQLTDGAGNVLSAEILDDHKKRCSVRVTERRFLQKSQRQTCVAISLLKNASRFEWFVEKATEIGVTEIIPMLCERTEKQHFRYERTKQILISAMMQSKQTWLPVLHQPKTFLEVSVAPGYTTRLIAHCEQDSKQSIKDFAAGISVQVLIGPEGDFSRKEISLALQNNFEAVTIGQTRLRSETAGVVAAAILCL